ncbi:MAG: excinuclease ABC subunit A, partial [Starkeya sp.]|nr:excinuclease ABC subunit A [Starkeya sp.]
GLSGEKAPTAKKGRAGKSAAKAEPKKPAARKTSRAPTRKAG